uniref:hypothetical protein n=1 Tax=Gracilimonas tropica TaxID=454600 RepID=UPI00058D875B
MNTKSIILSLGAVIAFTLGGYWLGTQQSTGGSAAITQSTDEMQNMPKTDSANKKQGEREILYWQA